MYYILFGSKLPNEIQLQVDNVNIVKKNKGEKLYIAYT